MHVCVRACVCVCVLCVRACVCLMSVRLRKSETVRAAREDNSRYAAYREKLLTLLVPAAYGGGPPPYRPRHFVSTPPHT
jgi:hypothetical protein